ncbi:MAG: RidA family protein [Pseudomonadota bacterium]
MPSATRIPGGAQGRCAAVAFGGFVYAVATDTTSADGIAEQTRRALSELDQTLEKAGSDKTGLIQATVYLSDIKDKAEMDEVWCAWIGPEENWPQRACVGVDLAGDDLIEIVVTATVL